MSQLKKKEKIGYASGDLAGNFIWMMVMFFLPNYYTDAYEIPAAAIGTMFIWVRVFDAFSDPVMGIIADRTNTKWGKYRPYILWLTIPFGIAGIMMFTTPDFQVKGKIIYAYVTYFLMMLIFTGITIPYNALSGVLTLNQKDRTQINTYRFVAAYAGGLIVQGTTLHLVDFFGNGDEAVGFQITMICFAIPAMLLFYWAFRSTRERVKPEINTEHKIITDMTDLLKNRPWIILFFISLILLIYVFIRSGSILYYFEYYLGNKKLATAFMFSGTVVVLLGTFITKELTRFISKKRLFILSMIIITLSLAGTYIAKPNQIVLIFALQILFSLGSGPTMPLLWSMYADVADYSEWKTGRRATGLVFSASTFAIKFGAAIGGAAILWLLAFYNYEPNVIQPEKTLNGIRLLMSVYPAFGAFVVLLLLFFYNLDQQKLTIISKELMDKKNLAE